MPSGVFLGSVAVAFASLPGSCSGFANDAAETAAASRSGAASDAAIPQASPANPGSNAAISDFWFSGDARQGGVILARAPSNVTRVTLDGKELEIADDGYFLMGFNRDAESSAVLAWLSRDGRHEERSLQVAMGNWQVSHINLALPRGGKASQRRAEELARIGTARAINTPAEGWRQSFVWPVSYWEVSGGRISDYFGSQRYYRGVPGGYHTGLDIAAPGGTPFVAPADGVVTLAAAVPFSREGYLLMLDHGRGLNSAFLHSSKLLVKEGDEVKQGQVIGLVGATGGATGPHLHWSMMWQSARVDPLLMLPKK